MAARKKTLGRCAHDAFVKACAVLGLEFEDIDWDEEMTLNECAAWERVAHAVAAEARRRDRAKAKGGGR